jgi:hypothetical protein
MIRSATETVFEEFFDLEDTVELGSVYFNIRTYEIVGFIPEEKLKNEIAVDLIALSVDPKAHLYWWVTPYAYCLNNPIKLVDPNGMEVIITGDQAQAAFSSLQEGTNLTLSIDKNGKVTADGDVVNDNDQQLLDAINSQDVTVNIDASDQNSAGEYHGTTYDAGTNTASSSMHVDVKELGSLEKSGAAGSGMMHEVTEGHQMGLIAIKEKTDISAAAWTLATETITGSGWERTIHTKNPLNPRDYDFYNTGHSRATRAPNEMSRKQASSYKSPQLKYARPIFERYKF